MFRMEPIIYRTVLPHNASGLLSFLQTCTTKPADFLRKHVHNLGILHYPNDIELRQIYETCTGVKNALLPCAETILLPSASAHSFSPARLTFLVFVWQEVDFTARLYHGLTHLDIGCVFAGPESPFELRLLPNLTHFAMRAPMWPHIEFFGDSLIVPALECPTLVLCLLEIHQFYQEEDDLRAFWGELARPVDPRLVVTQDGLGVLPKNQWIKGTRGERDKWDEAEATLKLRNSTLKSR